MYALQPHCRFINPNLGVGCGGGGVILPPPSWFSLNNSKTVRAVTLVSITCPSLSDIGQNSDGGISDFQISGQSPIKENCYNFRIVNCLQVCVSSN